MVHIIYFIVAACLSALGIQAKQPLQIPTESAISRLSGSISQEISEIDLKYLDSIHLDNFLRIDLPLKEEIKTSNP